VWVSVDEARALARTLSLDLDEFGRRYLRQVGERYALLEAGSEGACVFLDGTRCGVYDARPAQCRSYPFWASNLESAAAWARAAAACEGIRDGAPLLTRDAIDSRRRA
jgi:Fe-S-cluster containining protein